MHNQDYKVKQKEI